jgi:hypothetical protein
MRQGEPRRVVRAVKGSACPFDRYANGDTERWTLEVK